LLYVNGVLNGTVDVTDAAICNSTNNLKIGWSDWTSDIKFNGTIDEARIWNRSLSASEISQMYKGNLMKYNSSQWYFYSNQSSLTIGGYTYYALAKDTNNNENQTETRTLNITEVPTYPPTMQEVILNSTYGTNYTTENLTAYAINVTDADNESVRTIFNWYKNNTPIMMLNMPFEGGSNATWTKDYALGNNGTVTNAAWNRTAGYNGFGAYRFDGDGDYISISSMVNLSSRNFTLAAWAQRNSFGQQYILAQGIDTTNKGLSFGFDPVNKFQLGFYLNDLYTDEIYNDTAWHFWVGTYNADTNDRKIYSDGVLVENDTATADFQGNGTVYMGRKAWATTNYFNGTIDEVMIFNRTLTSQQVAALFNNRTDRIVSQELNVNDTWKACITPNDGTQDGATNCSNNLTIRANVVPLFSNAVNSSANFTKNTNFTANITIDNDALDAYIFATNASGTWTNKTVDISGIEYNASESATIGVGRGSGVCWYYWANDTSGLNNQSSTYCFAVNNTAPTQSIPWIGSHNRFARSLVGEWRFENSNATWTYDETGRNNGTVVNATLSDKGRVGRGFEFNGVTNCITLNNIIFNSTDTNKTYSVSAWIKSNSTARQAIVSQYAGAGNERGGLEIISGNLRYWKGGNNVISTKIVNDNVWHFVAWTKSSNETNGLNLYIDGLLNKTGTDIYAYESANTAVGGYACSSPGGTSNSPFNGSIDEVAIWNRSLGANEIADLYNTTRGKFAYDSQDIGASANETNDVDNDAVINTYNWLVNNISLAVMNMPFAVEQYYARDYALGNNGTMSKYTTSCPDNYCAWTTGKVGNALQFDGVNNAIQGPATNTYVHNSSYTLMLWANALNKSGSSTLFLGVGGWDTMTYRGATGYLAYSITYDSCPALTYTVPNPLSKWVHVAVVVTPEPNAGASNKTLYVNGTAVASACVNISTNNAALRFDVCGYSSQTNYAFNGTCDEFRLWNRSLTATEIINIYNNESIGQYDVNMNRTNLKAEYNLNQTTSQTAIESSQGLNATLYGYTRPQYNSTGGKYGGAYQFDGTPGLNINVNMSKGNLSNFSVCEWVYKLSGQPSYSATFYTNDNTKFTVPSGYTYIVGETNTSCNQVLNNNQWNYYCIVFSASDGNKSYIYLNGTLMKNCSYSKSSVSFNTLTIGKDDCCGTARVFNGTIDEVMIFNRTLSASEIKTIYESGYRNIMKAETTLGETWQACITPNDGALEADTKCTSEMPIQTLSSPILFRPNAGNLTVFDRKSWLEWFNLALDFVNYEVMVSNDSGFASSLARGSDIASGSGTHSEAWGNLTSYQNSTIALPVDALNYWKARAYSEDEYGTWSTFEYFTIPSVVSVNFTVDTINFGNLLSTAENDTTSNNPYPFVIQNDGNVLVNGTVTSTFLWTTVPEPSRHYQYKFRVNETGAFNETLSKMNWENCTDTASELANLAELLYEMNKRAVFMDIKVAPPSDEPAGAKNAIVTLNVQIAE